MVEFSFEVVFRVQCLYCNRAMETVTRVARMSPIPFPTLPEAWAVVNGSPICSNHRISITNA